MTVKIIYDGLGLLQLAILCGTAPCAILAANGLRSEKELKTGQELIIPVVTANLVNPIK